MSEERSGKAFIGGSYLLYEQTGEYRESDKDGRDNQGAKVEKII